MALYESAQYSFSIQYPSDWVEDPPELGITASFASSEGEGLIISEEDLVAGGLGSVTLEEFVDSWIAVLVSTLGAEIISR